MNFTSPFLHVQQARSGRRSGFSITELLVVIGVIVLLASLLMVAMGRVRTSAMRSQTQSVMASFAAACDSFQIEHGMYPGVIPDRVLAQYPPVMQSESVPNFTFTSTENALLHMMGGYRLVRPNESTAEYADYNEDYEIHFGAAPDLWRLKIRLADIGQGPVINGKQYAPYYTPGQNEVAVAFGQVGQTDTGVEDSDDWIRIPDLMDAWEQPIIFMRQVRTSGPLVGLWNADDRPQFAFGTGNLTRFGGMTGYVQSTALGNQRADQMAYSILNNVAEDDRFATFAQLIRHPAFGPPNDPLDLGAASRGAFVLISAGKDGVYFSQHDGPGRPGAGNGETDIVSMDPQVIEEYDDLRFFGGR